MNTFNRYQATLLFDSDKSKYLDYISQFMIMTMDGNVQTLAGDNIPENVLNLVLGDHIEFAKKYMPIKWDFVSSNIVQNNVQNNVKNIVKNNDKNNVENKNKTCDKKLINEIHEDVFDHGSTESLDDLDEILAKNIPALRSKHKLTKKEIHSYLKGNFTFDGTKWTRIVVEDDLDNISESDFY